MACGYSSDSTLQELSFEYQHNRVKMVFKTFCIFLPWTKIASARKGFNPFTLRAVKRGLTIMEIFYLQKHFLENI